jgi:hypothetical protein
MSFFPAPSFSNLFQQKERGRLIHHRHDLSCAPTARPFPPHLLSPDLPPLHARLLPLWSPHRDLDRRPTIFARREPERCPGARARRGWGRWHDGGKGGEEAGAVAAGRLGCLMMICCLPRASEKIGKTYALAVYDDLAFSFLSPLLTLASWALATRATHNG